MSTGIRVPTDYVFDYAAEFAAAVPATLVPQQPLGVQQLACWTFSSPNAARLCRTVQEYCVPALAADRMAGLRLLVSYLGWYFPEIRNGPRVMGYEYTFTPAPPEVEAYLTDGTLVAVPQAVKDAAIAARQAEIDAHTASTAADKGPAPIPLTDADFPDTPPDFMGLGPMSATPARPVEVLALCGVIIWAFRQSYDAYTARQFTELRPTAIRRAFHIDPASATACGALFPDGDAWKEVTRFGSLYNGATGPLISRLSSWDGTSVSDHQRPVWLTVSLLGDFGTGKLMDCFQAMKFHESAINKHHALISEAVAAMPYIKAMVLADKQSRRWVKAIAGPNLKLLGGLRLDNISGAGRMARRGAAAGSSIDGDFGMRSDVADIFRTHLIERGATAGSRPRPAVNAANT